MLASPALALAGVLMHREAFSLLALALVVTVVMWPALSLRRGAPWFWWLGMQVVLLTVTLLGFADLLLESMPVVINAALAWLFARTLSLPRPLIARCIVAVEGEARLHDRGVARYARQLTAFWAGVLAANALVLALLLLCVDRSGLLAHLGLAASLRIHAWWAVAWLQVGGYVLPALVFVLEYAYRRWHLRHLHHLGLAPMLLRLAASWPHLLRDRDAGG